MQFFYLQLLHLNGFSAAERQQFRDICHSHVIQSIKSLVAAARQFEYDLGSAEKYAKTVEAAAISDELDESLAKAMTKLWNNSSIQKAYGRYAEFQLNDSAK